MDGNHNGEGDEKSPVTKDVHKDEEVSSVPQHLDVTLGSTCEGKQDEHHADVVQRSLTHGEYNYLRIHKLLTTIAKEATQYLLHKRLKKVEQDKRDKVSKRYEELGNTYEGRIRTLQAQRQQFEKVKEILDPKLNEVLKVLDKEIKERNRKESSIPDERSNLSVEYEALEEAAKESFGDLKCRIIRLCVLQQQDKQQGQQQGKEKGGSGIVNHVVKSLKHLKPKFEEAMEAFRGGKRDKSDFACLSLDITLILTLLRYESFIGTDILTPEQNNAGTGQEKSVPGSASDSHTDRPPEDPVPSDLGRSGNGEQQSECGPSMPDANSKGDQANDISSEDSWVSCGLVTESRDKLGPDMAKNREEAGGNEAQKLKVQEDNKAANGIYEMRNHMSHLDDIDCIGDKEYKKIMNDMYDWSMCLVNDGSNDTCTHLTETFKTLYGKIQILGQPTDIPHPVSHSTVNLQTLPEEDREWLCNKRCEDKRCEDKRCEVSVDTVDE